MANRGRANSGDSQFFIIHQNSRNLDGRHAVFGRVTHGLEVVDQIAGVKVDTGGRWGPKNRPIKSVVIESISIEPGLHAVRNGSESEQRVGDIGNLEAASQGVAETGMP